MTTTTQLRITNAMTGDEFSPTITKRQVCDELRWVYGGTRNDSRLFARMVTDEAIDVIEDGREGVQVNLTQLLETYPKLRVTVLRERMGAG